MNPSPRTNLDDITPTLDPVELVLILLAVAAGTLAAAVVLPMWLPGLSVSLLGDQPKAYWYLARASGFIAFVVMWLSVALGLSITNKMARLWNGAPTANDLHQFTTWLAVALTIFHALILIGDRYIQSTPAQVVLPFGYVNYRPQWVGVGQIAFYLTVIVAASFYFRKRIGYQTWRKLHYTSFLIYVLITVHGIFSGTDTASLMFVYAGFGLAIYFLTIYRIVQTIRVTAPAAAARHNAPATAARPAATPAKPAIGFSAHPAATPPARPAPASPPAQAAASTNLQEPMSGAE